MNVKASSPLTTWLWLICALLLVAGCDKLPFEQDPSQRPIPAQLPVAEREQWRKLPLEGAHNFRDLGGYKTKDGRTVKWGVIYRSSDLSELTDRDLEYLQGLAIKEVVDFRSDSERDAAPDRIPTGSKPVIRKIEVAGTDVRQMVEDVIRGKIEMDMKEFLIDGNAAFATEFTPVYRDWMQSLNQPGALPQVFHCTGGKDRAGYAAAILLLALGVPEETVIQDYLKTNEFTEDYIDSQLFKIKFLSLGKAQEEEMRDLLGVREIYIRTALDTIKEQYGSFDNYLKQELGIDDAALAKLRNNLLE